MIKPIKIKSTDHTVRAFYFDHKYKDQIEKTKGLRPEYFLWSYLVYK